MTDKEYKEYYKIAMKICGGDERTQDLLHDVLIALSTNDKFISLEEKNKKFFFVRAISNQFYSKNSYFFRQHRRTQHNEFEGNLFDTPDIPYEEQPSMEWVKETLEEELRNNKNFWYNKGLFEMYLEHKKLEKIHALTMIPKYSIRQTIKEMKLWLRKKWQDGKAL